MANNILRIISGDLKGKKVPYLKNANYRPSTSKLREAIFSIISSGEFLEYNLLLGGKLLDICSGTGAISFEAISRGMERVTLIDIESSHIKLARETAEEFGVSDKMSFLRASATSLPKAQQCHNLVFIDPPYDKVNKEFISKILESIISGEWIENSAIIMIETDFRRDIEDLLKDDLHQKFEIVKVKLYGNSKLSILRYL